MFKNERELQGLITQVDDELDEEKEHHKKTMETLRKTEEDLARTKVCIHGWPGISPQTRWIIWNQE